MAEPVVAFDGVEIARGGRTVLHDVTLAIGAGEAWCLIGPNGAGKSTLLDASLGTIRARRGSISRAADFADRRTVGFVPQRCTLDPTLPTTVAEFIELGLVGLGTSRRDRQQRIGDALAAVDLDDHARRPFWNHSEGQRQRILLARALARRPHHLLLDEPTASLDPAAAARFWESLAALRDAAALTVICATHDLSAARGFATHVAVCIPAEGGSEVVVGSAEGLATSDAFGRAFGRGLEFHR